MSKIICLIGPSGSGKTTIGNKLKELNIPEIVSHTTRQMRQNEVNGSTYYFVDNLTFNSLEKIEEVEYAGNRYATSVSEIENKEKLSDLLFCIVTFNGYLSLKNKYGDDNVISVYIATSMDNCIDRMYARGDKRENIESRIKNFKTNSEFELKDSCKYVFNNDVNPEEMNDEITKMLSFVRSYCSR